VDPAQWLKDQPELEESELRGRIIGAIDTTYDAKVARIGNQPNGVPIMRHIEKDIMLKVLDQQWRDHLGAMDYLRQGIHLRGYAQKDYRYEFKREAFELFTAMLERVKFETVSMLAKVEVRDEAQAEREEAEQRERLMRALQAQHAEAQSLLTAEGAAQLGAGESVDAPLAAPEERAAPAPFVRGVPKVGRNDPCPCGSGKKYKQCHGQLA
jgi:preprotein translocase subunit SecA